MEDGMRLLDECGATMAEEEGALEGQPHSLLARRLTAVRKAVTDSILAAAQTRGVTSGKWMLFPMPWDVDAVWRVVADATASGQLGSDAKVATKSEEEENSQGGPGSGRPRLVCVYTNDFADVADVQRVVQKLDQLGLVRQKGSWGEERGIYYKCGQFFFFHFLSPSLSFPPPSVGGRVWRILRLNHVTGITNPDIDAFTHLGIESRNRWGLPASRYSSRDMLPRSKK